MKNNELKDYIIDLSANYLCKCDYFSKNYGKDQIVNILNKKIKCIYTDIVDEFSRGGYIDGTITLYFSGKMGKLQKEDIENNEYLLATVVHECVHAFFADSPLKRFVSGYPGKCNGLRFIGEWVIGTGLDEGYTEWIKTKTGCSSEKTLRYDNLVNIFNQLETIFNENTIMSMGKLNFKELQTLLKLNRKELLKFYEMTDELRESYWGNLINKKILETYENDDSKHLSEVLNSYSVYNLYKKRNKYDSVIKWQKENGLGEEITDENFIKYCRYSLVKKENIINKKIAEIEEFLFEHYIYDYYCRCIKNGEVIDLEIFEKVKRFYLLCDNNANEFINNPKYIEFKKAINNILSKNKEENRSNYQFNWNENEIITYDNTYTNNEKGYSSRR